MNYSCITIDSNVFAKSFLQEGDAETVKSLFRFIAEQDLKILCPDIFLYEVLSIAAQNSLPLTKVMRLFRTFEKANLHIAPLTERQLELAMRMAEDGNDKSGYPSIYDSSYHAVAISFGGIFITADKRHVAKAKQYGNIALLHDWEASLKSEMKPR